VDLHTVDHLGVLRIFVSSEERLSAIQCRDLIHILFCEPEIKYIDVLRDPETDVDAWILYRSHQMLYLAAAKFASGDKEGGYKALEESVRLCEIIFHLPIGTELSYNTPVLDLLRVRVTETLPLRKDTICTTAALNMNYPILSGEDGWTWFDCVRNEERFCACMERMKKHKPDEIE